MERTLSDQEMVTILEVIARDPSNKAAQIAAIKALRELTGKSEDEMPAGNVMDAAPKRSGHLRAA